MIKSEPLGRWNKEKSEELYGIKNWGAGYFSISENGNVLVDPFQKNDFDCSQPDRYYFRRA